MELLNISNNTLGKKLNLGLTNQQIELFSHVLYAIENNIKFINLDSINWVLSWKDKNTGEQKEQVEWHRVVIFGRLAEIAEQYLKKGSKIFVEGKLQTRDWEDKDGNKRYTTEVVADLYGGVQILGSGGGENSFDTSSGMNQEPAKKENLDQTVEDDELPF